LRHQQPAHRGRQLPGYRSNRESAWKGDGGVLAPDGTPVLAGFVSSGRNSHSQFIVKVALPGAEQRTVVLTRADGRWQWLPKIVA